MQNIFYNTGVGVASSSSDPATYGFIQSREIPHLFELVSMPISNLVLPNPSAQFVNNQRILEQQQQVVHQQNHILKQQIQINNSLNNIAVNSGPVLKRDVLKCVFCTRDRETAFRPCGHALTCLECGRALKICPKCNAPINSKFHIRF